MCDMGGSDYLSISSKLSVYGDCDFGLLLEKEVLKKNFVFHSTFRAASGALGGTYGSSHLTVFHFLQRK